MMHLLVLWWHIQKITITKIVLNCWKSSTFHIFSPDSPNIEDIFIWWSKISDSIQDTISVTFPHEDKIHFSITKYIWHLKLWQHYVWQTYLPKSYRFFYHWSCIFWDIGHYRPKKLKNRHFWVTQTSKYQL